MLRQHLPSNRIVVGQLHGRWLSTSNLGSAAKRLEQRERLYKSRDHVTKLDFQGCRVSIVKCARTAQTGLDRWKVGLGDDETSFTPRTLTTSNARRYGEMVASSVMMSSFLKGEERIVTNLLTKEDDICVEAIRLGEVRGNVHQSTQEQNDPLMSISKILYGASRPYHSVVPYVGDSVEKSIQNFFDSSEQIPSFVQLGVEVVEPSPEAVAAAKDGENPTEATQRYHVCHGIIVQGLVDPDNMKKPATEALAAVRDLLLQGDSTLDMSGLSQEVGLRWFAKRVGDESMVEDWAAKKDNQFDVSVTPVDFHCRCTRDAFVRKIQTLDAEVLDDLRKDSPLTMTCSMCNELYQIDVAEF